MNEQTLSANKQALLKIRELKQLLAEQQQRARTSDEPIAIVSMACRFPNSANTPEKFWDSLVAQEDLVGEIPEDRWDRDAFHDDDPTVPGKMYARKGVFLDQVDQMSPEFFGISPREAAWVDPQQRLLMEVGWEAIERAGWLPEQIAERTGVFIGWMHNDYQNEASDSFLNLNPYIATGAAGSFLPGRLAFYLGLEGPSIAVDTACSSSLVALHLAIQSLQLGDCDQALVGGVNVICSPTTNILTCKLKALSPSGHSRAFDAAADGYLRGEGCGIVTLRRLSDAQAAGDSILAVVRGSAVGHNGAGAGLTVPNPKAQEKVIRAALDKAGLDPREVDYLEAHGTGTELGDPIEVNAASAAYCGQRSSDNPLLIGSVKTNIGHLEAAAGMAGLIKVLLSMQHGQIPGQMNFETPNPHIPWDSIPVSVLTETTEWPNADRRIAGVSAFGMSGTNAHVVMEAPQPAMTSANSSTKGANASLKKASLSNDSNSKPLLLTLSGKCEEALFDLAAAYVNTLRRDPTISLAQFARQSNTIRTHFGYRAAIVVRDREQVLDALQRLARGSEHDDLVVGNQRRTPRVAWQFTGQGSQYIGMGRDLYENQPVFRAAIEQCREQIRSIRDADLLEVLFPVDSKSSSDGPHEINNTHWTQPAIFALQMGLAKLLTSWNLRPDVVLGHSVGQYAAACVAGVISWEDGLRLITERGRLIGELPAGGRMLAVFAPIDAVQAAISSQPNVSLAAINGTHIVISGDSDGVQAIETVLTERGVRTRALTTSHAFHSDKMEPALAPFTEFANQIEFQTARLPLVCNVSGTTLPADHTFTGEYWAKHIREAVAYAPSIESLTGMNCDLLVELGPSAVLTRMAAVGWDGDEATRISCLQREGRSDWNLARAIAEMYVQGAQPDFKTINSTGETTPRKNLLPTYPFQRRRFWGPDKPRAAHAEYHTAHPLLGTKIALAGADSQQRFESFVDQDSPAWMPDHEVMNAVVLPGAAFIEMAIEVASTTNAVVANAKFEQPLRPTGRTALQTVINQATKTQSAETQSAETQLTETQSQSRMRTLETFAQAPGSEAWVRHFSCQLADEKQPRPESIKLDAVLESLEQTDSPDSFYEKMNSLGLNYGPEFRCIQEMRFSEDEVLTHLQTASDIRGYHVPPTLLDAALHSLAVGLLKSDDDNLFLPVGIDKVECFDDIEQEAWCHARWKQNTGPKRTADLTLYSAEGNPLLRIEDLQVQQVSLAALRHMSGAGAERLVHEIKWQPTRLTPAKLPAKTWLLVRPQTIDGASTVENVANSSTEPADQFLQHFSQQLQQQEHRIIEVRLHGGAGFNRDGETAFSFCGANRENWEQLFDALASVDSADSKESSPAAAANPMATAPAPFDGVTWWLGSESGVASQETASVFDDGSRAVVNFTQAMIERRFRKLPCGMQWLTQNGIAIDETEESVVPHQTKFWGLGRVLGAEQPELRCRLVDLSQQQLSETATAALVADLAVTETRDNQHVVRDGQLLVPRMSRSRFAKSATGFTANPDGCYLITGGLGMLGRQAALWLARNGARQLVLVSRRQPDEATQQFIEQIESAAADGDSQSGGCSVIVHSADMSSRSDVEALFARFANSDGDGDLKSLAGIIHAAGVLDDGLLESQTVERFEKVLAPKITAATLLDELSRPMDLDLFVLYSSAASVLGSPGQSNYALGNAYLDGLAGQRRSAGLPGLAINWGPWSEGMADDERILKRLSLQGISPLAVDEAHAAMEKMIVGQTVQATVMDVDWRKMRIGPGGDVPPLLEGLVGARKKTRGGDSALVSKLRSLGEGARRELMVSTVQNSLQAILSTPEPPVTDRPLIEMGLDSLMAVEFGTELQQMLGDGFNVGATMLFDHPTVDAISDHVLELIAAESGGDDDSASAAKSNAGTSEGQTTEPMMARDDIAIVGMSCRFPGAENVDQFWQNLLNGVDSVCDIPNDRWDIDRFYSADREPGKMYTRRGGFLSDIADFDARFFNLPEQEACWIDPQHRMLLENSYRAMEDAGIPAAPLADANVGVFMGIMGSDYAFLPSLEDDHIIRGFQGAGLSHSAGVGRISYLFGFEGPSVAVDTASSSSLVAVFQAMRSLQDGNCNMAIAGGVNAILAPVNSLLMSKAGLLSPDGRCKSFSKSADGFGRGEGCGVVVLKRLSDAERDGDRIMAVIRGGAVMHNGRGAGITTPSGKAQTRVIQAAIKDAGVSPAQVQYLEAHGTGTEYGDPMEIGAAVKAYGKGRRKDAPLLVGSVKANISHLEAAGGSSGLIKTVLALHHGTIPQQIHCDEPSPHVPWKRMPAQMISDNTDWPECERRSAGITALGLVGTNAHLILSSPETAEATETKETTTSDSDTKSHPRLLVISARCEAALKQLCGSYDAYLQQNPDVDLDNFCFTVSAGRRHFERRSALVFETREELQSQLRKLSEVSVTQTSPHFATSGTNGSNGHSNGASTKNQDGHDVSGAMISNAVTTSPKLAWVFPEQAIASDSLTQILRSLATNHDVVHQWIEECDQRLQSVSQSESESGDDGQTLSLSDLLLHDGAAQNDTANDLLQFVLQSSLAKLWLAWGVQPDAAIGFGVGQYTAACASGCLCYLDALQLVQRRATILNSIGTESAASTDATDGESSTAFEDFEQFADQFNYYPPELPLICSLGGEVVPIHRSLGGSYWRQQMSQPANTDASYAALQSLDCKAALVLAADSAANENFTQLAKVAGTVVRSVSELQAATSAEMLAALGQLYRYGYNPCFATVVGEQGRTRLSLPTYPFQRKRYWITEIAQFMESDKPLEVESVKS